MCNAGGGRNLSSTHAFTLAEVLVTLGIIGVVSAMTVPSLMQNHQRKTYVTQLHKVYNELSQALLQYQTDKNAVNLKEAGLTSQAAINEFITNYFKIVQSCEKTDPCFASDYKHIAGQAGEFEKTNSYVLSSGASIRPRYYPDGNILSAFVVDINNPRTDKIYKTALADYYAQGHDGFTMLKKYDQAEKIYDFDVCKCIEDYMHKHPEPVDIIDDGRIQVVD